MVTIGQMCGDVSYWVVKDADRVCVWEIFVVRFDIGL